MSILGKRFGIEVEFKDANMDDLARHMTHALAGTGIEVRREHYNHQVRGHWKIVSDGTVTENGVRGGELVSPPIRGADLARELGLVLGAMNSHPDVSVNYQCGLHVHVSWGGMTVAHVQNIVKRYADFENVIDSWIAPSRRGNANQWCATTVGRFSSDALGYSGDSLFGLQRASTGKYYKLNLNKLEQYGTVEFRHHSGTTDVGKITNWIKWIAAFVDASASVCSLSLNYKRKRKIAFGEIREQVAERGWTLRFANTGYKLIDDVGNVRDLLTLEQLDAMYVDGTRRLNENFSQWFATYFREEADYVFRGVDADVVAFLGARADEHNQRQAS